MALAAGYPSHALSNRTGSPSSTNLDAHSAARCALDGTIRRDGQTDGGIEPA